MAESPDRSQKSSQAILPPSNATTFSANDGRRPTNHACE
eukprot:CAMPEP_0176178006 /NCGR_PEP_ID=MMETSP0120_2-20121206/91202_1 /TAXON_ID=160619 /ORGANISM="Kryptoperidinium foliaceum, Strain CCMP 1326" /LENGTH=38 /DNA_ID= /DNA_START= /DNA_END= /DNA_ORIENTATION=